MNPPSETVLLDSVNAAISSFIKSFASSPTPQAVENQLPLLTQAAATLKTLQGKRVGVSLQVQTQQLQNNLRTLHALLHQFAEFYGSLARQSGHSSNGYSGFAIPVAGAWNEPGVVVES